MAEIHSEIYSEEINTAMAETAIKAMSTSTPSQTPNASRPVSEISQLSSDSGSDYSDTESPNASRPTSMQSPHHISMLEPAEDLHPESQDTEVEPERPQTAKRSRPTTMHSHTSVGTFEDVSLDEETHSHPGAGSNQARQSADALQPQPKQPEISVVTGTPQPEQRSPVSTSSRPESPEGSDYSASPPQSPKSPRTPTIAVSPLTPEEGRMSAGSLRSIALSESSFDVDNFTEEPADDVLATPRVSRARHLRKPSSLEILENWTRPPAPTRQSTFFDITKDEPLESPLIRQEDEDYYYDQPDEYEEAAATSIRSRQSSTPSVVVEDTSYVWRSERVSSLMPVRRGSSWSDEEDTELDWSALDKTEEQEKEDRDLPEGVEDESTAFLLARLEQENAKITADPKSTPSSTTNKTVGRLRGQARPPSMAQLKRLVSQQDTPSIRYSFAPDVEEPLPEEPPPMTELEFWAALVQDYPSTASRLPTLTTTKIRAGIPPPLRGVVWTSMSGARDKGLEEAFETLQNEKSSYEGIINKDVGRSFPGVELFRDAEGEGQKMLGRVLKCFSLHDKDIGYCQGLGFLVGPLLMNMGEKDAFCVLVRLMDHYALRPSFLPSLSGLHMRIFQFSTLLAQHHPELSNHLQELGVEPAYLSQWFLSCFAVTCPLPMLFRIYDVIFAEGANETVMRVALAVFRRNEEKMLASTEFEEVMQLLLGRALWDVYACNADELVDDFTSLGHIITHARLAELEKEFESKDGESVGQSAGFLPDVQAAASRFLGRLWFPNHGHTPSKGAASTLSPPSAEKESTAGSYLSRPGSFLRRSPSKQNINDSAASESSNSSGSGSASSASTAATEAEIHDASRESQFDSMSLKSKPETMSTISLSTSGPALGSTTAGASDQHELHSQIEDLLLAISEMQREHAQLAAMLQKEREERNDDHRIVKQLLSTLSNDKPVSHGQRRSMPPLPRLQTGAEKTTVGDKRRTLPARPRPQVQKLSALEETAAPPPPKESSDARLAVLVQEVQTRLDANARYSASFETKAQLRSTLTRTREQLATAEAQVKDLSERAEFSETSLMTFQDESESLRSEVEELRNRVNDDFKEKKKLELTIENLQIQMRMEAKAVEKKQRAERMIRGDSTGDITTLKKIETQSRSRTGSMSSGPSSAGGLREFKLGRRDSVGSVQSIRSMKSQRATEWPSSPPPTVDISPSPPSVEAQEPEAPPTPTLPLMPSGVTQSSSLAVPAPSGPHFARRTTSLAAKEVFATQNHEVVPEEALLLELVNAKTAEATAKQEVDEMKRSLQMQKRRNDETLLQLQAEIASAKLEAAKAKEEAEQARDEARAARLEVFDASELTTPLTPAMSFPVPSAPQFVPAKSPSPPAEFSSPLEKPEPKKADTAPASTGGGWFWSRRNASTTKAVIDKTAEIK